jgi:hypothetical protein
VSGTPYTLAAPSATPFQTATYNVMRVAGLLGLASMVEGAKIWVGFFREIIGLYQQWIRIPIYNALLLVWPASFPTPPRTLVDLFMIWSSFFAAANYHIIREEGRNVISHIYANENNLMKSRFAAIISTIVKVVTIFIIGPILYPMLAIANYRRGKDQLYMTRWLVMKPREILKYVAQQLIVLGFLLFISYQMKLHNVLS